MAPHSQRVSNLTDEWTELNQIWSGHKSIISTPGVLSIFDVFSVSRRVRSKVDFGRKIRTNFALFDSVKLKEGLAKWLNQFFVLNLGANL